MKQRTWKIVFLMCLYGLTSCKPIQEVLPVEQPELLSTTISDPYLPPVSQPYPSMNILATRVPYVFKTSIPETVTIHGELLAMDPTNLPDPNDAIFLVPIPDTQVTTIPFFVVGEVPQAEVHEPTGEFVFTDIEPGLYAVVVLTVTNAQIPARTENGDFVILRIGEADRDQTIELGFIRIP